MTSEEIKKALAIHTSGSPCEDCPYEANGIECYPNLLRGAFALIKEQEQEIERLKAEKGKLKCEVNDWKQRYESRDSQYLELIRTSTSWIDDKKKQAKIDVLEELKEKRIVTKSAQWGSMDFIETSAIDEMIAEIKRTLK